jgi:hypothetical protein
MPEGSMVDKKLLYGINSRRLEGKGCVHGRNKSKTRGYSLNIFQGMVAHNSVHTEIIHDLFNLDYRDRCKHFVFIDINHIILYVSDLFNISRRHQEG